MGKFDLPIILGTVGIGAGVLFFTKPGQEFLDSLGLEEVFGSEEEEGEGFDLSDWITKKYPKNVARDPGAFIPGSDRWYDIVRKNRGRKAADRLREMVLKKDLEAYFGSI